MHNLSVQHMQRSFRLSRWAAAFFAVIFFCGCRPDGELTMEDALSQGRCRELIRLYESRLSVHPDYFPYKMNLSVMYALSCRLDHKLTRQEIARRKDWAIETAHAAVNQQLALPEPNLESLLHAGSTLAQIYATFGEEYKMYGVFERLENKLADDKDAMSSILHGRKLLRKRLEEGYPFDTPNPFEGGKVLTRSVSRSSP